MALVTRLLAGKSSMQVSDALTGSINLPSAGLEVGDMELISQITLDSSQSTVTFGGIPQNYKKLRVVMSVRTNRAVDNGYLKFFYNDVNSNGYYRGKNLVGSGTSAYSDYWGETNQGMILVPGVNNSSYWCSIVMDINEYSSSSINKTSKIFCGYDMNGTGWVTLASNAFFSTSPITSITFGDSSGSTLPANSYFSLYGIRG